MDREIIWWKTTFIIATKNPITWSSLTKHVKDLYGHKFNMLKKKIKEDIRWWKGLSCSWISRINKVKIKIWAKEMYRFYLVPIKMPTHFFTYDVNTMNGYDWIQCEKWKKSRISKTILSNKNEDIMISDFKLYFK